MGRLKGDKERKEVTVGGRRGAEARGTGFVERVKNNHMEEEGNEGVQKCPQRSRGDRGKGE